MSKELKQKLAKRGHSDPNKGVLIIENSLPQAERYFRMDVAKALRSLAKEVEDRVDFFEDEEYDETEITTEDVVDHIEDVAREIERSGRHASLSGLDVYDYEEFLERGDFDFIKRLQRKHGLTDEEVLAVVGEIPTLY